MNFMPLLDMGMGLAQGWAQGTVARAQAKASNEMREARNSVERGKTRLAAQMQALNNNRILANAGKQHAAMTRTISRTKDAQARRGFEQSIQQAEQLGAAAAAASVNGSGGSAIQVLSSVAGMTAARQRENLQRQQEDTTYEQLEQLTSLMPSAIQSLGGTYYMPNQDFSRDQAGSWTSYLLGGLMGKKDSLQTFLGDMGQTKTANPNIGPPWLSPWAGNNPAAQAAPSATTTPVVPQSMLMPTPLQTIRLN